MKIIDGQRFYTIGEAAAQIERTPQTIINWYKWKEEFGCEQLPEPRRDFDKAQRRFFTDMDIEKLRSFRDSISYGDLADYNRQKWGKRKPKGAV